MKIDKKNGKNKFYVVVNTRIRQLTKEIQNATKEFELNPNYNNRNEQVAIVEKMEAVRDLSRIIKFYFKEQSENDTKQCRDYTNMDFDGLNGWIPAYTDLKGKNHPGKLSFWDPINHSAIDITEEELATVDIPFLGHENGHSFCWFNAFNSMISHIPSFYLYFLKLGQKISNKSKQEQNDIKNEFPLSYEIAMYMKRVNDAKNSEKLYHEIDGFVTRVVDLLPEMGTLPMKDVKDYKTHMMQRLNNELNISITKNLPQLSKNSNKKNSISMYNYYQCGVYSSPIFKMFYTDSASLSMCSNNKAHFGINFQAKGDDFAKANDPNRFGNDPTLSKIITNGFSTKTEFKKDGKDNDRMYCNDCGDMRNGTEYSANQFFSSRSTLTVISIQPVERIDDANSPDYNANREYFKGNKYRQVKFDKKMPAFVKSGDNYFELISIGTHIDGGYNSSGYFVAPHWVAYVKDMKNDKWHFCDDKNVDNNIVDNDAKHGDLITDNIDTILKKTSKNGANYIYKKCDKSKYDTADKGIKEDISETAFDQNGKGITKSPLYLISAKAKNYALQKDNPTDADFESAVGSFKNYLQSVGILNRNGKIKQASNQDLIDNNFSDGASSAGCTAGRKTVFVLSGGFAVAAIILAIEALTTICIIATILAVVLFLTGCFYNLLKEEVDSCLPGGGSGSSFENNPEEENYKFISKNGTYENDDPYNNPKINNGNKFYGHEQK